MLVSNRFVRRSWPVGPVDLLLQAVAAPEPQAREAWRIWNAKRDFDRLSWSEMRLIAAFSERIGQVDPQSPLRPRIDGLTKHMWTTTQLALRQAADAFDQLARAGIPFIVFKGGALHAEGFGPSCRRIMGDVDLLVHNESARTAVDALTSGGWSSVTGESPEYLRRLAQFRISGNYRKGRHGEIDLHINPFHFSRFDRKLDDSLWRDARQAELALRSVLIPDPTDAIVIGLAHAPLSNSGDWAVDIVTRITHQPIDWERLSDAAIRRGLVPSCLSGLRYLREVLQVPIPDATLSALTKAPVAVGAWLKYWSNVRDRKDRNLIEKAANRGADRLLRRQGYSYFLKDSAAVTVTRPTIRSRASWSSTLPRRSRSTTALPS